MSEASKAKASNKAYEFMMETYGPPPRGLNEETGEGEKADWWMARLGHLYGFSRWLGDQEGPAKAEVEPKRPDQPPVFCGEPPSGDFRDSFSAASTLCQVTCAPCGRTHFVTGEMAQGTYETGELEELEAEAALRPEWFVREDQFDDISFAYVGGRTVVLDCPCNWLRTWETFIRQAERPVASFLRKRAKEERALAASKVELAKKLEEAT